MKPMKKVVKFKKSMKYGLKDENLVRDLVTDVKEQLGEKNLENHKYDVQMLIDICNCVEKHTSKKSKKKRHSANKKDLVLKIFADLYDDVDLNLIDSSIETILNNKLVKKYDWISKVYRFVSDFFLEK